jgi:hypothetical protein
MSIVNFRRGRRHPAAPSNENVTRCYRAILVWRQGLKGAPEVYPIGATDVETELIRQRVIAALKGGR